MLTEFHEVHRKRYGHADENRAVELVNVRVRMMAVSEKIKLPQKELGDSQSDRAIVKQKSVIFDGKRLKTKILRRDLLSPGNRFEGPAIVHEYSATTVVPPEARVLVDEYSNLLVEV